VQCSVRPERIQLADGASPNTLSGTVMDVIYFGDHLRLRCKTASEAELMVKLALNHAAVPTPGHTVHLHAPAQHMRVYL
jgi:putative spermidine/putrescine transport system ATP-binding protein